MKKSTLIVCCIIGAVMWYFIIKWIIFMVSGIFQ